MNLRRTLTAAAFICCAWLWLGASAAVYAQRDTTLDVDLGWNERLRAGRWTPITVKVANPKVQPAVLEVYAPQGGAYAMLVRQYFTLGPSVTTLQVFAPLRYYGGENATVVIRNVDTGKALATFPPDPGNYRDYHQRFLNQSNDRLIGVSGARTSLD